MNAKKMLLGILAILLAMYLNITNLVFAKSETELADVTIEQYLATISKELLKNFDNIKLEDGVPFEETFSVTPKTWKTYYSDSISYSAKIGGTTIETKSVTSYRTGLQRHELGIQYGDNKQIGTGVRFIVDNKFLVIRTQILDINLSNYTNNAYAQRVDIVDLNQKKGLMVTVKQYGVEDHTNDDVPYEIIRQIYTFTGELKENDFATLYFLNKKGLTSTTKLSVKREDLEGTYGTIIANINPQPNTYDIVLTDAPIYIYEAFAQMAQPRWDFHSKDAFFKHRLSGQYEKDKITYQQIADLQKPFAKSNHKNPTTIVQTSDGEKAKNTNNGFSDISGHWAEALINEAVSRGITKGITRGKFDPNGELTYEQFMAMLARVLTEKDFIQDRISGCNMLLVNADKAYEATKGDFKALKTYRENYANNNPDLAKRIVMSSDYLNKYGFTVKGSCDLQGWHYYDLNETKSPYSPGSSLLKNVGGWAIEGIHEVPYVAGFVNYYNLTKNNGQTMKDYSAYMEQNGIDKYYSYYVFNDYYYKRIKNVYNSLNYRYFAEGKANQPLKREDMALILYSFLDYEQQRLIDPKQSYYDFDETDNTEDLAKDYKYRTFKSNYSDIPAQFQIGTVIHNPQYLKNAKALGYNYNEYGHNGDFYFDYLPEKITATSAKVNSQTRSNFTGDPVNPIQLTSRGIILAVSDAGLLTGAGDKFYPRKTLTRAEGVAVVLRLEKYLKERYDFLDADEMN